MNEGLFKTAVGGFKKADVLAFIDNLDTQYKQKEQEYRKKIAELNAKTKELTEKRDALAAELERALSGAREDKEGCAKLEEQLHAQSLENEQLRAQAEEKNRETDGLRMEILTLQQQLKSRGEAAEEKERAAGELERKVAELEEQARARTLSEDKISRVLLEARGTADRMLDDAGARARRIEREAHERVSALAGEVGGFRGSLEEMRTGTQAFADTALRMLAELERAAAQVGESFDDLAGEEPASGAASAQREDAAPEQAQAGVPADSSEGVQGDAPFCGEGFCREDD